MRKWMKRLQRLSQELLVRLWRQVSVVTDVMRVCGRASGPRDDGRIGVWAAAEQDSRAGAGAEGRGPRSSSVVAGDPGGPYRVPGGTDRHARWCHSALSGRPQPEGVPGTTRGLG